MNIKQQIHQIAAVDIDITMGLKINHELIIMIPCLLPLNWPKKSSNRWPNGQGKNYNELNQFMTKMLEESERKSFDFQVEQYLKRLKDDFQKEFLDKNHYIDLNAETRIEKKARTLIKFAN